LITTLAANGDTLSWDALPGASAYDIVRGGLGTLTRAGGGFASSTEQCVADNAIPTTVVDAGTPALGSGYWFLVRGVTCGGNGTYDSDGSQVAPRDPGIGASTHSCP